MNALQAKIAATDTEMLLITAANFAGLNITEASQRMAQAEVEEELIRRFPEVTPAVEAWSADLTNNEDLFTVILANINEMPVAA